MQGARVFQIEDDPLLSPFISVILDSNGHHSVGVAKNRAEVNAALEQIKLGNLAVDVFLADGQLEISSAPGEDALWSLARIKESGIAAKVVACSGNIDALENAGGFDAYIPKGLAFTKSLLAWLADL